VIVNLPACDIPGMIDCKSLVEIEWNLRVCVEIFSFFFYSRI